MVADFSVYIERARRGKGIGRLAAMAFNDAGLALYTRTGFTRVGVYREQGQLDGRWVDVVIMDKLL